MGAGATVIGRDRNIGIGKVFPADLQRLDGAQADAGAAADTEPLCPMRLCRQMRIREDGDETDPGAEGTREDRIVDADVAQPGIIGRESVGKSSRRFPDQHVNVGIPVAAQGMAA